MPMTRSQCCWEFHPSNLSSMWITTLPKVRSTPMPGHGGNRTTPTSPTGRMFPFPGAVSSASTIRSSCRYGVDAKAIVTHEMTHCFQDRVTQTATAMFSVHPWISEGEATWAMSAIVPEADAVILGNKWSPYVNQPTTVYAKRSYDAIGVYGHLSDLAGNEAVWPKLLPMVKIGIGGNDSDAFTALVEGHHIEYFTSWGSSYFVVSGNKPWTITGPGTPPTTGPAPQTITIDPQFNDVLPPAGPYQGELFQLSGNADIAMVSLLTGYGRLHDQGFSLDTALDASGPLALCLKGGCKCPDGSPGASMFTKNAVAPLSIGINGGDTTAQVGVVARSLDDFCKKPEP